MEVMEDGNLMDKVNILIQRDMEYYTVSIWGLEFKKIDS